MSLPLSELHKRLSLLCSSTQTEKLKPISFFALQNQQFTAKQHTTTMQFLSLLHFYLLSLAHANTKIPGDSPFNICDADLTQHLTINWINLAPNPPKRGLQLQINAGAQNQIIIEEGSRIDIDVRLGYIKLLTQSFDLCDLLADNTDWECPVVPGDYILDKVVDIPLQIPMGKYNVLARAYNVDETYLACLNGELFIQ